MQSLRLKFALALICFCGLLALAQSKDQPSRYVWWETFQTAVGKTDVFSKVSMQFREVTAAAAPDVYWVVGKPITGEDGCLTFVTFHDNMASIEKMLDGLDKMGAAVALKNANVNTEIAESETSAHWALAEYSKELSYRPDMVPTANPPGGPAAFLASDRDARMSLPMLSSR